MVLFYLHSLESNVHRKSKRRNDNGHFEFPAIMEEIHKQSSAKSDIVFFTYSYRYDPISLKGKGKGNSPRLCNDALNMFGCLQIFC